MCSLTLSVSSFYTFGVFKDHFGISHKYEQLFAYEKEYKKNKLPVGTGGLHQKARLLPTFIQAGLRSGFRTNDPLQVMRTLIHAKNTRCG